MLLVVVVVGGDEAYTDVCMIQCIYCMSCGMHLLVCFNVFVYFQHIMSAPSNLMIRFVCYLLAVLATTSVISVCDDLFSFNALNLFGF